MPDMKPFGINLKGDENWLSPPMVLCEMKSDFFKNIFFLFKDTNINTILKSKEWRTPSKNSEWLPPDIPKTRRT